VTRADDERWMRRAIVLARRDLGRTTPNPVVGACVVAGDGVVVGHGSHHRAGEAHAEVYALEAAGAAARGATLYSTLEPCVHIGRTGPCTARILAAGISRVVAAVEDPDPRVNGQGFEALRAGGVEVTVGVLRREVLRLNAAYLMAVQHGRPFVILKAATSLDGKLAARPGVRTWLTAAAANRHAQTTRSWVDAIAVGSDTLLVDDPILTARDVYRERPLTRVVFDRRLRTPTCARIFSTLAAGPVIILTTPEAVARNRGQAEALETAGAVVVPASQPGMIAMLQALAARGIQSLLLEGGVAVHAAAWDENVVDYVQIYVTPDVIGEEGVPLPEPVARVVPFLHESRVTVLGPDVLIEGHVHRAG